MPVFYLSDLWLNFMQKLNMEKTELIEKLKVIIEPYIQDEDAFKNLTETTDFVKDLKINSANLVDIILDIEDAFDIRLENEDMEQMLNVKAAIEIVQSKQNSK
jgi:acyl carrier protein